MSVSPSSVASQTVMPRMALCIVRLMACALWLTPAVLSIEETEVSVSHFEPEHAAENSNPAPAASGSTGKTLEQRLNRARKSLRRDVGRAIGDYNMIEDGDLVMVC